MGDVFWGTFQYEIDGNISPMSAFEIKVLHKNEQSPKATTIARQYIATRLTAAHWAKFAKNLPKRCQNLFF